MTLFACAKALEANPPAAEAIAATDWDICGHGYRWIKHFELDEAEERRQIAAAVALIRETTGKPTARLVLPLRAVGKHPPHRRREWRLPLRQRHLQR